MVSDPLVLFSKFVSRVSGKRRWIWGGRREHCLVLPSTEGAQMSVFGVMDSADGIEVYGGGLSDGLFGVGLLELAGWYHGILLLSHSKVLWWSFFGEVVGWFFGRSGAGWILYTSLTCWTLVFDLDLIVNECILTLVMIDIQMRYRVRTLKLLPWPLSNLIALMHASRVELTRLR